MPKYSVRIFIGLVGCKRNLTLDTNSDLGFEDDEWESLTDTEKDEEIVNHCLERVIEFDYTEIKASSYKEA